MLAALFNSLANTTCSDSIKSKIGVAPAFRRALMAWQQKGSTDEYSGFFNSVLAAGGVPASHAPEGFADDLDSPVLRTHVLLASLMLHELTHAFQLAYFRWDEHETPGIEPFVGDARNSELGYAAERHIFGGITRPSHYLQPVGALPRVARHVEAHAPFGIYTSDKWAQWYVPDDRTLEEGKDKDFATPIGSYPVPQRQVYEYFTDEMWTKKVPRYGHEALKFVKIPEWASTRMPGPDPQRPWIDYTLK